MIALGGMTVIDGRRSLRAARELQNVRPASVRLCQIPLLTEPSNRRMSWVPAFAGMTLGFARAPVSIQHLGGIRLSRFFQPVIPAQAGTYDSARRSELGPVQTVLPRVLTAWPRRWATLSLALAIFAPSTARAEVCPPAPPPFVNLDIARFYGDAKGSVIDPKLQAKHDQATEPLTAFLRTVTGNADKSWTRGSDKSRAEAARCALSWIVAWATGNAWLGTMAQHQAEYQRKWDLAGLALAYIKVRRFATADDRRIIEPYLMRFADVSRAFFDDPARARNNHWYWLGLAVGAVAIATDGEPHWQMARGIMTDAARDIAADGTLPMEMARDKRALHYHAFAVMALVTLAELAAKRGEDFYGIENGALHRLVAATAQGLADPSSFDRAAGVAQERPLRPFAGWLPLYAKSFPDRAAGLPGIAMPTGHRWLGGDVKVLGQALGR